MIKWPFQKKRKATSSLHDQVGMAYLLEKEEIKNQNTALYLQEGPLAREKKECLASLQEIVAPFSDHLLSQNLIEEFLVNTESGKWQLPLDAYKRALLKIKRIQEIEAIGNEMNGADTIDPYYQVITELDSERIKMTPILVDVHRLCTEGKATIERLIAMNPQMDENELVQLIFQNIQKIFNEKETTAPLDLHESLRYMNEDLAKLKELNTMLDEKALKASIAKSRQNQVS